jgi:adenylate cyclase
MNARTLQDDVASVVAWLVEGARTVSQPQDVLGELCDRLVRCSLPLHRVAVFVTTLHPDIMGRRFLWRPGEGVLVTEADYAMLETDTYRRSPVRTVFATAQPIRLKLGDPDCPQDYGIVEEPRVEGVSDYLIQALPFTSGVIHAISWTTTRAGGFAESDLAAFEAVRLPLARLAEIYALRRTAANLLDTYVGRHAGEHILQGRIRRGDSERIEAVMMLTDLRGFTAISDRLPGEQVLALLNGYFDGLVPAIARHGGEVLKYTGDGLLAIFPVAEDPPGHARGRSPRPWKRARPWPPPTRAGPPAPPCARAWPCIWGRFSTATSAVLAGSTSRRSAPPSTSPPASRPWRAILAATSWSPPRSQPGLRSRWNPSAPLRSVAFASRKRCLRRRAQIGVEGQSPIACSVMRRSWGWARCSNR